MVECRQHQTAVQFRGMGLLKEINWNRDCVIRDEKGEERVEMAASLMGVTEAEHAELLGIWNGIALAKDLSLRKVVIESDCASILSRIKCGK